MTKQIENPVHKYEAVVQGLLEKGYACIDNFLSPGQVRALRVCAQTEQHRGQFRQAGIGQGEEFQLQSAVRSDLIQWIDPRTAAAPVQDFMAQVQQFTDYVNRTCFLGIKEAEMHFAIYPKGSFYRRHLDSFRDDDARQLSFICYLNEDWTPEDGGGLRMYFPSAIGEDTVDITPYGGRLVCFDSRSIEHEVLMAHRSRYSLTGWFRNQVRLI